MCKAVTAWRIEQFGRLQLAVAWCTTHACLRANPDEQKVPVGLECASLPLQEPGEDEDETVDLDTAIQAWLDIPFGILTLVDSFAEYAGG